MKIKKLAAAAMAGIMVLGMGTSVSAESPITSLDGTDQHTVQATYATNGEATIVYSVDIAWGNMKYTYTVSNNGTWNPEDHQYEGRTAAVWSCASGADEITVTNHSNADVTVAFSYAPESGYDSIAGSFKNDNDGELSNNELQLATAEDTLPENAPEGTAKLSLDGALNKNVSAATTIGTVTVRLETPVE